MMTFRPYSKENYEAALMLKVFDQQKDFCPTIEHALAISYICPWDEKMDPYLIYENEQMIGAFYVSYTPLSEDNYWFGGFFIDYRFQGRGYGKKALINAINFLKEKHPMMAVLSLTVVKANEVAYKLYESLGFIHEGKLNSEGELIFRKRV